jgi:hypothetical protein
MPENPRDIAMAAFAAWNASLQTKDPKEVVKMYAPKGVLLPTVSDIVRNVSGEAGQDQAERAGLRQLPSRPCAWRRRPPAEAPAIAPARRRA